MPDNVGIDVWGEFESALDDRFRVTVPQELRAPLGEEFVITRGPDKALWLLTRGDWDLICREMDARPGLRKPPEATILQRQHGGRALVHTDAQSRLIIPRHLREYAGISDDQKVVLVGVGDKIELWQKANWIAYMDRQFRSEVLHNPLNTSGSAPQPEARA